MLGLNVCFIFHLIIVGTATSYKILFFYPFATRSHLSISLPVADELASRGHKVKLVTPFNDLKVHPSIRQEIVTTIDDLEDVLSKDVLINHHELYALYDALQTGFFNTFIGKMIFDSPVVLELIAGGLQFDVIVVNSVLGDFGIALSPLLANHTVVICASPVPPWIASPAPKPPSSTPTYLLELESRMSFWQRLVNSVVHLLLKLILPLDVWRSTDAVVQKYVPGDVSTAKAWDEVDLYIENVDPVLIPPRPSVPNIISFYGVQCSKAKPLPLEFLKFMETGKDGVIVFAMGSLIKAKYMPPEMKEAFLSAFKRLRQKVLWKFEDDTIEVPQNVKVVKWIPQQDILGHPNTRLFITHGGLLSLQEALYHQVPMIGIPLFADQPGNVARLKELGLGEILHLNNITAQGVYETVQKVLQDPSYSSNIRRYSSIFKDFPTKEPAASVGAFWIEYVVRHVGARHLRTEGQNLNFFQYFLIDVILFVIALLLSVVYLFCKMIRLCSRLFSRSKLKNE